MPRKIFISFLGTGKYEECNYQIGDQVYYTRFVQEVLVKHLCADWTKNDLLLFGLTAEAQAKHWQPETGETGLKNLIQDISGHIAVDTLAVPPVEKENDIWNLFTLLFDCFEKGDEVYLDITHSWRFQPMLFITLLQYLKTLKSAEVKGVFYGAYEPSRPKAEPTPIMNLTPFSVMQDWAQAASVFVNYGIADQALDLNKEDIDPDYFKNDQKSNLEYFQQSLQFWSSNTQTIRGEILKDKRTVNFLRMNATQLDDSVIPPIRLMAKYIVDDLKHFPKASGIEQLESLLFWYARKNRIVEGYTLLSELLVERIIGKHYHALSRLVSKYEVENESIPKNIAQKLRNRRFLFYKAVRSSFTKYHVEYNGQVFNLTEDIPGLSSLLFQYLIENEPSLKQVSQLAAKIKRGRDDINHAGLVDNAINPFELARYFNKLLEEYKKIQWD